MSIASNKPVIGALLLAASLLTTCHPNPPKREDPGPQLLLDSITACLDGQRFEQAIGLMHRLDSVYPKAIHQRKEASNLLPRAMEGLTLAQMALTDQRMAEYMAAHPQVDSLDEQVQRLNIERARLERQLQIARNQMANLK